MTIKIACPACRGFEWSEATRDNWDLIVPKAPLFENCDYCNSVPGDISLLKHNYTLGKHKEIKKIKKFIKILDDFKKNKLQNQGL